MSESDITKVKTVEELSAWIEANGIRRFKMAVTDIDGILRGKYVEKSKFLACAEKGFGFCDVVVGWDSGDVLYDNTKVAGWHTGYRDAPVKLDLGTLRRVPFEPDTILLLGSFVDSYADACARSVLHNIAERAASLGFDVWGALEYEFFLFQETPESARAKGYRDLKPFTPGMFGYSMLRSGVHAELYHELLDTMVALRCPIEGLHTETGPGVLEAALQVVEVREAADRATLFKTFTKILAQRRGLLATFMAKWNAAVPGQSGHIHLSLFNKSDGKSAFYEQGSAHSMSKTMRSFVAGQVKYLPEILAMVCPTINDYRRLVPGMWAPTTSSWGVENRTTALRVIPGSEKSQRVEFRIGPADANPYLALAAALGTGLRGIEEQLELGPPVLGNAYQAPQELAAKIPSSLEEAAQRLEASQAARELFGSGFVDHFVATRNWEVREYKKHVSDWELARYFEII
jgi:glutamine synthetase